MFVLLLLRIQLSNGFLHSNEFHTQKVPPDLMATKSVLSDT